MLIKVGQKFETWMRKVLPDPLVIAIILTLIVGLLAVIFTPTTPIQVVENWSKGFWELIAFTMQVAFGLIAGAVLANHACALVGQLGHRPDCRCVSCKGNGGTAVQKERSVSPSASGGGRIFGHYDLRDGPDWCDSASDRSSRTPV